MARVRRVSAGGILWRPAESGIEVAVVRHPDSRRWSLPKGRPLAARYLREFVDEMKASGFVAASLEKSGQKDAAVAP